MGTKREIPRIYNLVTRKKGTYNVNRVGYEEKNVLYYSYLIKKGCL